MADADVITDETLTLRNVRIDGEFFAALTSNEGDLVCTLDGCDLSAYVQAVGYHVNVDTHKQLIVRKCHFHDSGLHSQRAALIYVSPGVAINVSDSRFSASHRFGVYINGATTVRPLYSLIINNVFEETLAQAIQVSKNNRPLIWRNLIKTYFGGIAFFGSYRGAEVLENVVVQAGEPAEGWHFISGGVEGGRGHVRAQGNSVETGAEKGKGWVFSSAAITLTGDGAVWDVDDNLFVLNHAKVFGIQSNIASNVLAFVSRNRFMGLGGEHHVCMGFNGGTLYAKGNAVETESGYAFSFLDDALVMARLEDNDVAASVTPLYVSLAEGSAGKISGSGNNFPGDYARINWMKDFKYQMITPREGACPTAVASAANTRLPMSYDTVHISGNVPINNFYYYHHQDSDAGVTRLFCGRVRVIFDDEGATVTGGGNIEPGTTGPRVAGRVYRFVLDPRTARWYEYQDAPSPA